MERKPNLIFVFGDQHRQCDVGCAGNPQVQTPAMDQLAQEGMFFPNTFTNVPICVPARGCLMTGKHPLNHKAVSNDLPLPLTETGIAEVFKASDYATGYIGKWHLGGMPRDKFITPEMRFGFDHWVGWNCHHNYFNAPYHDSDGNQMQIDGYEPDFQTDQAIQYCRDHVDEPFCLYMSWGPPHNPYEYVPERYKEMYPPEDIQLRPNAVDTPATRKDLSGYYAHITALDENLGRLMHALDELGIADDTILVEWRGVRTHRHTYARHYDGTGWLLYDNDNDPYQLNNLIDDENSQDLRAELEADLQQWLTRINDPFLPGLDHIRQLGLSELWNISEQRFGGRNPRWA